MRWMFKLALLLLPWLAGAAWLEDWLRRHPNSYLQKDVQLRAQAQHVKTLVLGDSQAEQGIWAPGLGPAYVLAHPSQPLVVDSLLLAHYAPRLPHLRRVLVVLGVHRLQEDATAAGSRIRIYDALYGPPTYNPVAWLRRRLQILQLSPREAVQFARAPYVPLPDSAGGSRLQPACQAPTPATGQARRQELATYARPAEVGSNLRRLLALQAYCRSRKLEFLLVLPPASPAYRRLAAPGFATQQRLLDSAGLPYADFRQALPATDFADADHPCDAGAHRFTQALARVFAP